LHDRIITVAEGIANEMLTNTWWEDEYHLDVCVVPLMVPLLKSTVHIRNFVRSSFWKYIDSYNPLYGWNYTILYFTAIYPDSLGQPVYLQRTWEIIKEIN